MENIHKADKSEKALVPQGTIPLKVLLYKQPDMEIISSSFYQYRKHRVLLLKGTRKHMFDAILQNSLGKMGIQSNATC